MSNFNHNAEKQAKSSIHLDKIKPEFIYVLFVSTNPKCKNSPEIMQKITDNPEFNQILNIMEIETLIKDGEKLPVYVDGVPMLIMQHKQTGQIAPPLKGDDVFAWFKEMIKPQGNGGGGTSAAGASDSGVSISTASKLRFDPRRIDSNNRDPGQFQIPIESSRTNDDVNQKLAQMADDAKKAWAPKGR